jgi:hypothetical protein
MTEKWTFDVFDSPVRECLFENMVLVTFFIFFILIMFCLIRKIATIMAPLLLPKVLRYIPSVQVAVSEDNGETYSKNIKKINYWHESFYLKFEIVIKRNCRGPFFREKAIPFFIYFPQKDKMTCRVYDDLQKCLPNKALRQKCLTNNHCEWYKVCFNGCNFAIASKMQIKASITLKCVPNKKEPAEFSIVYGNDIAPYYYQTFTIDYI